MAKTAPFIVELTCIEFSTKFGGSVTAQNFISKALRVGGGGGNSGFSFLGVVSSKTCCFILYKVFTTNSLLM